MRLILIGDSIRDHYRAGVMRLLAGRAEVWRPAENGGDSRNVLAHLEEWALSQQADVLHVNCGLHDIRDTSDEFQVPLANYARNVAAIADGILKRFSGRFIWATTTPVIDEWHQAKSPGTARREADVQRYNQAALAVMAARGVPVNDLHDVIVKAGPERCLSADGVHMNEHGNELLARAVADAAMAH